MKKQAVLAFVILAMVCCYSFAYAANGVDWLYIQKRSGLSAEEIAEQAKEAALKQKRSFSFDELQRKEEIPGRGEAISFAKLRDQDEQNVKLVPARVFELEVTIWKKVADYCDVPTGMSLKDLIGAVLKDNGLDWNDAKALHSGYEFFIRYEWLSEEHRESSISNRIAELEARNAQLQAANLELGQLERTRVDKANVLVNGLKIKLAELAEAKEALLTRLSLLEKQIVSTAKVVKAGIGFNSEETIENISAVLRTKNVLSWVLTGMAVAIFFLFIWVFKLHGDLKRERSFNTESVLVNSEEITEDEDVVSMNVVADTHLVDDKHDSDDRGALGLKKDAELVDDEIEQLILSEKKEANSSDTNDGDDIRKLRDMNN
ncbi:MAG: hypothetical protein U9O20_03945 [Patescibacteria group bacterium]|nr:hypothetical protein [Patescibacteria group bacterium]